MDCSESQQFQIFYSFSHHVFIQYCVRYLTNYLKIQLPKSTSIYYHTVSKDQNTRSTLASDSNLGSLRRQQSSCPPALRSSQSSTQATDPTSQLTHIVVGKPGSLPHGPSTGLLTTWQLALHGKESNNKRASPSSCSFITQLQK